MKSDRPAMGVGAGAIQPKIQKFSPIFFIQFLGSTNNCRRPVSPSRSADCVPGQHRRVARADQRQGVVRSYSRRTRNLLRAHSWSPCYIPSWSHSEDIGRCSRSMWRCRRFLYETSQWDIGTMSRTSGSESPTYLSDPCSQYNSMKPTNWRLWWRSLFPRV